MWMVYLLVTQWVEGRFLQTGLEVNFVQWVPLFSFPPAFLSSQFDDIQALLPLFTCFDFLFCPHGQNGLVHCVAFWLSFCKTWEPHSISSIPSWVLSEEQDGPLVPLSLFNIIIQSPIYMSTCSLSKHQITMSHLAHYSSVRVIIHVSRPI